MRAIVLLPLLLLPAAAGAQRVTFMDRGAGPAAALIDSVVAQPHVIVRGTGALVLPRDSTVTTSLLVLGRSAYVASRVRGDVVVVGGDLFLRPGAEISGRAVAVGGTVAETSLGHVGAGVQSLRDETFTIARDDATGSYALSAQDLRVGGSDDAAPRPLRLAGIYGVKLPAYDRVDGLSLPLGVQLALANERVLIEPTVTYRSRLGAWDPAVALRVGAEDSTRFEGRLARDTRSNDRWIAGDLVNSLKTFAFGTDARNYFRSDLAEGRMFLRMGGERAMIEPYAGFRVERVSPISATGDVYSIGDQQDTDKVRRPNPAVERGTIGSALLGARYQSLPAGAPVVTRLSLGLEQAFTTPTGTSSFTQLTADGGVEFPTFAAQRLRFRGHAVATLGDSVPRSRYAYLGGSRTLGLAQLLQYGGDELAFAETRYLIPVASILLPFVGSPTLSLIHRIGGAGVHTLGPLQQEVGLGLGVGAMGAGLNFELITGASGQHRTDLGVSVTLPSL